MSRRAFGGGFLAGLAGSATYLRLGPQRLGEAAEIPSRSVQRIAAGTRFETEASTLRGEEPGPHVVVVAGVHGDEPAPPVAARAIADLPLRRGLLTVCPILNIPAFQAGTRFIPDARYPDLNRNFPVPERTEPRGELAPHVWRWIAQAAPAWVLDLHEGWDFHTGNPKSMGSSLVIVRGATEPAVRPIAEAMRDAVDATVDAPYKRFAFIDDGPRGSLARSLAEVRHVPTLVLETTKVGQPIELRAEQHRVMVSVLLAALGMIVEPSVF